MLTKLPAPPEPPLPPTVAEIPALLDKLPAIDMPPLPPEPPIDWPTMPSDIAPFVLIFSPALVMDTAPVDAPAPAPPPKLIAAEATSEAAPLTANPPLPPEPPKLWAIIPEERSPTVAIEP